MPRAMSFAALLILLLAGYSPSIRAQSPDGDTDSGAIENADVADGGLAVSLEVDPRPLTYGRTTDAVIEVTNRTGNDQQVVVKALLGEVAHFVSGDPEARFETPGPAQERIIVWPARSLPAGGSTQLGFKFLVSWDVLGDVYLQVDALDATGGLTPAVASLREAPSYPGGGGGFLGSYGYILVSLAVFGAVLFGVHRASQRIHAGQGIASSLSGLILGFGVALMLLSASMLWNMIDPWLGWKQTDCEILDVRYSVDTSTSSGSSGVNRQQTTIRFYSGSLALRFEGPEGPVITTGYRKQSSISNPQELNGYAAGTTLSCYYDPDDPGWVVVERDFTASRLVWPIVEAAAGLLLIWFGLRSRRKRRPADA